MSNSSSYAVSRLSTGTIVIAIQQELFPEFQKLINRGLNVWDQAIPEIKELGDMIVEGKVQQDYRAQDTSGRDDTGLDTY